MTQSFVYHVCRRQEWADAHVKGAYRGSSQDLADGFIHMSGPGQVVRSVSKHRAGQDGLILLAVNPDVLGDKLVWEASRSNKLFPHLYGALPPAAVVASYDLPLGEDGHHIFPPALGLVEGV